MDILSESGTYALVLRSKHNRDITIGRLGKLKLRPGYYIYVGSAFGPGGIRARVGRHCKISKRNHWHIDYLTGYCAIMEVWYSYDPVKREQLWADILYGPMELQVPLSGFGASDDRGRSHLYYCVTPPDVKVLINMTHRYDSCHSVIYSTSIECKSA